MKLKEYRIASYLNLNMFFEEKNVPDISNMTDELQKFFVSPESKTE